MTQVVGLLKVFVFKHANTLHLIERDQQALIADAYDQTMGRTLRTWEAQDKTYASFRYAGEVDGSVQVPQCLGHCINRSTLDWHGEANLYSDLIVIFVGF